MVSGYKLEFTSDPIQTKVRTPLQFSLSDTAKIETEIATLMEKGAITRVTPVSDQFVSNLFLVPKRDGSSRPVINLKDLNAFLCYDHFKMEGIHLLRDLLRPGDWLGKVDLKDAYFVMPIWHSDPVLQHAFTPHGVGAGPSTTDREVNCLNSGICRI